MQNKNLRDYSIINLKPSDVRYLANNCDNDTVCSILFDKLRRLLSVEISNIAMLDHVYCAGVMLNKGIYPQLNNTQRVHLESIGTQTAKIFFKGLKGESFEV